MSTKILTLSDVLNRLMFQAQIWPMELSRRTGVPQATLQRIVAGTIERPRQTSLQPIADYFKISIEQLKGFKPINGLSPVTSEEVGWTQVPLLSWEQGIFKIMEKAEHTNSTENTSKDFLYTDAKIGTGTFALTMNDASMEPLFPKGTLLIIDPNKTPKDRSYVVTLLKDYPQVVFRQLVLDGPNRYLKPISPDFALYNMHVMTESEKIIGVLVQARQNYED